MTTPLADSGINDRLVILRPLIDQMCFEFIDVRYFGAVNKQTTKFQRIFIRYLIPQTY